MLQNTEKQWFYSLFEDLLDLKRWFSLPLLDLWGIFLKRQISLEIPLRKSSSEYAPSVKNPPTSHQNPQEVVENMAYMPNSCHSFRFWTTREVRIEVCAREIGGGSEECHSVPSSISPALAKVSFKRAAKNFLVWLWFWLPFLYIFTRSYQNIVFLGLFPSAIYNIHSICLYFVITSTYLRLHLIVLC